MAPMSMLLEILSRWPRYLSHGPATVHTVSHCTVQGRFSPLTRDVIGSRLALGLDQDREVHRIFAIPSLERLKDLETVGLRGDGNGDGRAVLWRCLEGITAWVVAIGWQTFTGRRRELEVVAVLILESVGERVEVEGAWKLSADADA